MQRSQKEFFLRIIFLTSSIAIISAYFIQYFMGYQPCKLCLIERIPYFLSILLLLIIFRYNKLEKFLILLLILTFLFSFFISIYHFGIEQGFLKESAICNIKDTETILSKEQLLQELQKKTVSCKDVTFRFFGLSLTSINIVISFLILSLLTKILKSYEKNK